MASSSLYWAVRVCRVRASLRMSLQEASAAGDRPPVGMEEEEEDIWWGGLV